jgi:hypothetical protein
MSIASLMTDGRITIGANNPFSPSDSKRRVGETHVCHLMNFPILDASAWVLPTLRKTTFGSGKETNS